MAGSNQGKAPRQKGYNMKGKQYYLDNARQKLAMIARHVPGLVDGLRTCKPEDRKNWQALFRNAADDVIYYKAYIRLISRNVPEDDAAHYAAEYAYSGK